MKKKRKNHSQKPRKPYDVAIGLVCACVHSVYSTFISIDYMRGADLFIWHFGIAEKFYLTISRTACCVVCVRARVLLRLRKVKPKTKTYKTKEQKTKHDRNIGLGSNKGI